ncbi:hypothetical protein [Hydrogenophaga sp. PBL-H3]|uniref:hypothetical protein n=1 Tax=Hydrogenophaga sp. PBL-H3 TaxID=434010 RepID=UPI00131F72FB|nr:hypothetical protein [Hydrogenophaga sp. PBL-H3]QHE76531.1 hypothetical protein F9Z45_10900 [Hydrogenophaga sp. PBL-H3]QHE80955.1 hypothetical protein F9Z44_10900 [Hydrogenophaga sp. PBL-H3]
MPSTIPYSPSLVLGSIVHPAAMDTLLAMSALQAPVDAAQDTLNSFISLKRGLEMTASELVNMNIDPKDLIDKMPEVNTQLEKAAVSYATTRVQQELQMQPLRAKVQLVNSGVESPIDYQRTVIKQMPLAADTLKMDAQYFSFDENEQKAQNTISNIQRFISLAGSDTDSDASFEVAQTAVKQINRQRQMHKIAGTLVLTASCTHRQASVLAPLVLDVDKAIRVWNQLFPDAKDKIRPDATTMAQIAKQEGTSGEKSFNIISGATHGSSFVGMVHILRKETTATSQQMESEVGEAQVMVDRKNFFSSASGSLGVEDTEASDEKSLLSRQEITSHVTVITSGVILGIASTDVQMAVKTFAVEEGKTTMDALAAMATTANTGLQSMQTLAASARSGQAFTELQANTVQSVLSKLGEIQGMKVKVLDVNSLMTAFDNYVEAARKGGIGVPINYYLKPITRTQLAQMWMTKYYPDKFLAIQGDDSAAADATTTQ